MAVWGNLNNYRNFGLLIARIGVGFTFIYFGFPLLAGGVKKWEALGGATRYVGIHAWPVVWGLLAATVETFGGFLLIIGLAFRPACLLLLFTMIVAILYHFGQGQGFEGAINAIENAAVLAGFLFIGPGKYSVDKK